MHKYETMVILNANLDAEANKVALDSLLGILTSNQANVLDVNQWGLRDFTYEINRQRRGFYVVVTFETETDLAVNEFNRLANINPNVVRHLVIRL
jgi:small subunit ribosomal protein S6